jgi:hypothetical protein
MSHSRECAHRAKHQAPLYSPPPQHPSKLRRIFDIETNSELGQDQAGGGNPDGTDVDAGQHDTEQSIKATEASMLSWWRCPNDAGEEGDADEDEDGHDEYPSDSDVDIPERDAFEPDSGLSSWDQLGGGSVLHGLG